MDIIPIPNKYGPFVGVEEKNKKYFHIYFNDNKEEIKRTELSKGDKVSKINIVIDYKVKSFNKLFFFVKLLNQYILKTFIEII